MLVTEEKQRRREAFERTAMPVVLDATFVGVLFGWKCRTRFFPPLFRSPHLEHPIFRWAVDGMNSKKVSSETGAVKKNCALTQREALKFVRL